MSDGATPPAPDDPSRTAPLELEPLPLELQPRPQTATAVADRPAGWRRRAKRQESRTPQPRRRLLGTPLAWSLLIHFVVLVLLFILFPPFHSEPVYEEPIRITLKDWHWLGDDPEADGTGPRGPVPETPVPEPPKGKETAGGFLDDGELRPGAIGVAGANTGAAFAGRLDGKDGLLAAGGGDGETEGAVHMALEWLARHQNADGSWGAQRFVKRCQGKGCTGEADEDHDGAATALALLPFLGAGHTFRDGPWKDVVRRGLTALRDRQKPDGRFEEGRKHVYADALATLALAEAYGLTKTRSLGDVAQRSVDYLVARQIDSGGWRYEPGDHDADSSATGWVAMALASARRAGLAVPDETLHRARGFLADRTSAEGIVGYTSVGNGSKSLLGVGYFVPLLCGAKPDEGVLASIGGQLERSPPRWPRDDKDAGTEFGPADPLHWYYGSLAAFQRGGFTWKLWNERLRPLLLLHQDRRGCPAGSWPPVGATGRAGGRVVVTALNTLALEVYYRYPRVASAR